MVAESLEQLIQKMAAVLGETAYGGDGMDLIPRLIDRVAALEANQAANAEIEVSMLTKVKSLESGIGTLRDEIQKAGKIISERDQFIDGCLNLIGRLAVDAEKTRRQLHPSFRVYT